MNNKSTPNSEFVPLTPAVFHILLALSESDQHGYRIMQTVYQNSNGQFHMGPGTLYGSIKRMINDGLIEESDERPDLEIDDERRRYYRITELGRKMFRLETERLEGLVRKAKSINMEPNLKLELS
jgi:DNA-binding PadR family transcriptional regulator